MRDIDAVMADATDKSPFSNSTTGEIWMGKWCWRPCKKDRDESCTLILAALCGKTPKEWTETGLQDYTCSEFEPDDEGGGDSQPVPPAPVGEFDGQVDMFAVFADGIVEQAGRELASR